MEKRIPVKNLYLLLIISLGLIGLGVGSTYAMFTASAEISNPISFSSNLSYNSDVLETINITLAPKETKNSTLNITNSSGGTINYVIWYIDDDYDIDLGVQNKNGIDSTSGSLISGSNGTIDVLIRNNSSDSLTVTIGLSSSSGNVVLSEKMKIIPNQDLPIVTINQNAALYITNLYTEADKTTVTNNSITYNYASSVSLMNDRLGGTTTGLDAGNVRYYGANPNNYIYFNCSDYTNQSDTTCELWRIIGVFDGKVKIIRNDSIGNFSWDNKDTSTGAETDYGKNDWTTARLMKLLNPNDYYEVDANDNGLGQSLYYTAQSGTCYSDISNATKSCDFTSAGLKNDTTRNMIEEVTWNLGGLNTSSVYSDQIYGYERGTTVYSGRPTSWTGKVALAYPSDYGYAADFNSCTQTLDGYDASTCINVNWMKMMFGSNYMWFLTPGSSGAHFAWYVESSGYLSSYGGAGYVSGVRPVLYLDSELTIESGDGSSSLPYRLLID